MRIRASIATIAVVALVAAAGTRTPSAAEDKTLTIGVLGPLSGGAASYGVELVRGAEMKADEINKAGGLKVGGDVYKIKLVSYDHKALAADAATAANKLVFQDKVKYIIGNAVVKALKGLGFEVVADEYYERGTKDFYPILTKLLASKPDMLDVAAAPAGEGGLILKQARELGFKGAKGWTAGTNPFTIIGVAGKEAAEGVWSPTNINVKSDFISEIRDGKVVDIAQVLPSALKK